jgi:hypothetical protein
VLSAQNSAVTYDVENRVTSASNDLYAYAPDNKQPGKCFSTALRSSHSEAVAGEKSTLRFDGKKKEMFSPTKSIPCSERNRLQRLLSEAIAKVSRVDRTADYFHQLTVARAEQQTAKRGLQEHIREHGCKVRIVD